MADQPVFTHDNIEKPPAVWAETSSLTPWEKNPRKKDSQPVDEVVASIKAVGFGAPLLVREGTSLVIAGHTRLRAALKMGLTHVPVRYMALSEREAEQLNIADNKLAELARWDKPMLGAIMREWVAQGETIESLGWLGWDEPGLKEFLEPPPFEPPSPTPPADPTDQVGHVVVEIHVPVEVSAEVMEDIEAFAEKWAEAGVAVNVS